MGGPELTGPGYLRKDSVSPATVAALGTVNHAIADVTGRITDLSTFILLWVKIAVAD